MSLMRLGYGLCLLALGGMGAWGAEVTVTVPPLKPWVEQVLGEGHRVRVLMPAGADPHHFQMSPRQMADFLNSDVLVTLGTADERRITGPLLKRGKVAVIDLAPVDIAAARVESDPHYWHSPALMRHGVGRLNKLEAWAGAPVGERVGALARALDELDRELKGTLGPWKGRRCYVMHPAFSFLEDYGLEQVAVESHQHGASPAQLLKVMEQMRADGTRLILMQAGHNREVREKLSARDGIRVVDVDLLAEDYGATLRRIAEAVAADLEGRHD